MDGQIVKIYIFLAVCFVGINIFLSSFMINIHVIHDVDSGVIIFAECMEYEKL